MERPLRFSHYAGCGNDFIIVDDRNEVIPDAEAGLLYKACAQQLPSFPDGIILVRPSHLGDARMSYFNRDGSSAAMCGNGMRATMRFLQHKCAFPKNRAVIESGGRSYTVEADPHTVTVDMGLPRLLGEPVLLPYRHDTWEFYHVDAGVPHVVTVVKDLHKMDVQTIGTYFRNHPAFAPSGVNVNFIAQDSLHPHHAHIRTYERGVEAETLSCGSGATAAALILHRFFGAPERLILHVRSGDTLQFWLHPDRVLMTGSVVWLEDKELSCFAMQ